MRTNQRLYCLKPKELTGKLYLIEHEDFDYQAYL